MCSRVLLTPLLTCLNAPMHLDAKDDTSPASMQDSLGYMPAMVFINALLAGTARAVLKGSSGIIRGPLSQRPQKIAELAAGIKVMYPQSKHGVFAPSMWNAPAVEQSAKLPADKLGLEFVHGYEGQSTTSNNIVCNRNGHLVYHIAALGIVFNLKSHAQKFFLGHNDDVLCLAMHPEGLKIASGQVCLVDLLCVIGRNQAAVYCKQAHFCLLVR